MLDPARLLDMVQVDETTRVRITVRRRQDTPLAQLQRLLVRQIVLVLGIQHTVGKSLTTAHAEQVARQPRAVAVDVVQRGALLLGHAGAHGAHAEALALVAVDEVGQDLAGGGDADAALVAELVQAALHAQPGEPVLAVCGTAGHGSQQHAVDLNHLLDRLRGNPVAGRGSRIRGYDDAALEAKGKCRRSVGNLDGAVGVGAVVCGSAEPSRGLKQKFKVSLFV